MEPGRRASQVVEQLLGIPSFSRAVGSIVERAALPRGRFEAHEFGRREHSTASGAALLVGLGSIPAVPDATIAPLAAALARHIDADGTAGGHDRGRATPTSWRQAQVLLGLLTRPHLARPLAQRMSALSGRLQEAQDATTGGWALRHGEPARLIFAFYPALALARAWRLGIIGPADGTETLRRLVRYLADAVVGERESLEERILAARALRAVQRAWPACPVAEREVEAMAGALRQQAWTPAGLNLFDRPAVVYAQPTWHAIIWRPLLYLALRGASPASPLLSVLGDELVSGYDPAVQAWHGPEGPARRGAGVSWASALAMRATYALATDLLTWGIDVEDWRARCNEVARSNYEFDVAISFAGADRGVASEISRALKRAGYRVFYDRDYQHVLLGVDLATFLQDTYYRKSRFAIVIVSRAFNASKWAGNWEWKAVLARAQKQSGAYFLPYVIEDVELPGLSSAVGYVSQREYSPAEFAALVVQKLRDLKQGGGR